MSARPAFADTASFQPSTQFVGGINPWTQKEMNHTATAPSASSAFTGPGTVAGKSGPKKGSKNLPKVDITTLKIVANVAPPTGRTTVGKYAPLFAKLKSKDAIECKPDEVDCVDQALRKYLKDTGKNKEFTVLRAKGTLEKPTTGYVWMWPLAEIEGVGSMQSQGGRAVAAAKRGAKQ